MRTIRLIFIVLLATTGFISCNKKTDRSRARQNSTIVDVMVASKENFPSTVEVNGTVLSEESIELYPEVSGRLIQLNMPDGALVKKGTVLARIFDADLQAQLEQQKVQLDLAEKTEQRLRQLLSVNGVNQADYDAALSQVHSIKANIKVLEAQIDKTVVRASFDGKLGLRLVSVGAFVTPQTHLGSLQQTDKVKIDFTVPEAFSDLVKVGHSVHIQTNKSEGKFEAVISAVEPQIDQETRNIKARARLKDHNLNPGEFVKVLFNQQGNGIMVPSNAIIPDAYSNQVIVVRKKKAIYTDIQTGLRNEEGVELTSGVNPGDSIVISGVMFVRPNGRVNIRKVVTQPQLASASEENKESNSQIKRN